MISSRYIVSSVTVQGYASDYKALSLQHPINHLWSPFLFVFISLIIWNHFPHRLIIIYTQSAITSLQSSHHSPRLTSSLPYQLDCLYHAGISLILTLLSCSTSIKPWDESMLAPTTTNCLTWASAYRSAPPPPYYLHQHIPLRLQFQGTSPLVSSGCWIW